MQILITHGSLAKSRVLHFNRWQMLVVLAGLLVMLTLLSGTIYHVVFLKAAREGWPVVSSLVKLVVKDEFAQRDRFMRENLDAMAQRVGEMQARLIQLNAMSERLSGLAGIQPQELLPAPVEEAPKPAVGDGKGGPFVPVQALSFEQLDGLVSSLGEQADHSTDLFSLVESRLFERRLDARLVPSRPPVAGAVGSGFGFRSDPFSGRAALHTGLDFPAVSGTPIMSAAGGVVLSTDFHGQYGNLVELDHGRGLVTRYAHASEVLVKAGDIVKRGQLIARVGTTGRSTGPHLHFEVMLDGVHQNPAKFLAGPERDTTTLAAGVR